MSHISVILSTLGQNSNVKQEINFVAFENAYLEMNFFYTGNDASTGTVDEYTWYDRKHDFFVVKSPVICPITLIETFGDEVHARFECLLARSSTNLFPKVQV